ncbi:hypothetical protein SAMN05444172_4309 [Burkholderia sp. GAS332]|uniref:hypothetical protein n=1 Tax=Paraburkholderia sediminicola TaxID=458836 RepID=UPI0009259983|nr:hypothetical protein SAMN05444172_4309 [Burkholderia sp. GAS332]
MSYTIDFNSSTSIDAVADAVDRQILKKMRPVLLQFSLTDYKAIEPWLKREYGATEVRISDHYLTDIPPVRSIQFTLNGTPYRGVFVGGQILLA